MRPDVLADAYYQDAELDWMIYLSNQIIDPYYNWYLNEEELQSYILDKYGDVDYPKQKIKFYRNNWPADDTELTPSFYNNTLVYDQKQYYGPIYGQGARIVAYRRKQEDWTTNTNKIFQYTVTYTTGNAYSEGELVDIRPGDIHAPNDGGAEVIFSNSSSLIVKNISGNTIANNDWTKVIVGGNTGTVTTSNLYKVLQENITNATANFWTSVSFYDWEVEKNEAKKHVYLLNPGAVTDTSNQIRAKLNE